MRKSHFQSSAVGLNQDTPEPSGCRRGWGQRSLSKCQLSRASLSSCEGLMGSRHPVYETRNSLHGGEKQGCRQKRAVSYGVSVCDKGVAYNSGCYLLKNIC